VSYVIKPQNNTRLAGQGWKRYRAACRPWFLLGGGGDCNKPTGGRAKPGLYAG